VTKHSASPPAMSGQPAPVTSLAPTVQPERMTLSRFVERSVDGEQDFSIRDLWAKIFRRKWIVATCVIVPTMLSLAVASLTPMTWQSSTKILVRYSSSESVFLKGLIPDDRVSLSGAASSEIIRSLPTLEEVIRKYDIQNSDLFQPTTKVIAEYFSRLYHTFIQETPTTPDDKLAAIAKRFQDSLRGSSAVPASSSKAEPIELLGNTSAVPQSVKGDELITLTVKAFNRSKVAEITNGLAQAFIDQYYWISAEDARRSFDFLSQLADRVEAEVRELEQSADDVASPSSGTAVAASGGDGGMAKDSAVKTTLANKLATLEAGLEQAEQVYREGSPEIERQRAEIDRVRALLSGQERLDVAKQALEQIKERRFQALNTERLYQSHLMPISIVEPAVTPPPSTAAMVIRLLVAASVGLLIGSVFALAVAIVLGMLDQRLFTISDVERSLTLPVLAWVPKLSRLRRAGGGLPALADSAVLAADHGLSQLICRLHAEVTRDAPHVVAVASTSEYDGKSFVSLLLAKAVARDGGCRVLLVDADPARASLSHRFKHSDVSERSDATIGNQDPQHVVVQTDEPNIDLMPRQSGKHQSGLQYACWLRHTVEKARGLYDLIIVDTPSFTRTGRTLVCCKEAEMVLLVVKSGVSSRRLVRVFLHMLQDASVVPYGVVLNFAYRHV
jgi:Mrp family chromosome partitioning ATPase/capsular polysaccharide biosynthesis protein